jgi:hypothetical protein
MCRENLSALLFLTRPKCQVETLWTEGSDQLVSNFLETVLEFMAITSIPCGAVGARNSVLGGETDIENVVFAVAIVAI